MLRQLPSLTRNFHRFLVLLGTPVGLVAACSSDQGRDSSTEKPGLTQDAFEARDPLQALSFAAEDHADGRGHRSRALARWEFAPTPQADIGADSHPGAGVARPPLSARAETIGVLNGMAESEHVVVTFELDEPSVFDLPDGDAERLAAVEERRAELRPSQDAFARHVQNLRGRVLSRDWLVNQVTVRIGVREAVRAADLPGVVALSINRQTAPLADQDLCGVALGGNNIGIDGNSYRTGNRETLLAAAYNGDSGGRGGGRVRIAIIGEADFLERNHLAFRFTSQADRIIVSKACDDTSCVTSTPSVVSGWHGNAVAHWAAGSVENGQDGNCTPASKLARSGSGSYGTQILFYVSTGGCVSTKLALQDAVANNADIVNMSFHVSDEEDLTCSPTFDCGGMNAAIRTATNSGVLMVGGASNSGQLPGCNAQCCMGWPARRPEVLTVGGVDTTNRLADYNATSRALPSPLGGVIMNMHTGTTGIDSGMDLMGPYFVNFTGAEPTNWYANSANTMAPGTSFSGPAIAGAAASILDGFRSIGWTMNARTLRLNLLMMGDAAIGGGSNNDGLSGISDGWGAGRLHAVVPSSGWATAPYWWAQSPFTLNPGVTAYGCVNGCNPMPSSVRQYNWVLFFEDADFNDVPLINIAVIDYSTGAVIRQDTRSSMTKRIQLRDSEIWGRRLQLRVTPVSMGSSVSVYSGDFYHSDAAGWTYH